MSEQHATMGTPSGWESELSNYRTLCDALSELKKFPDEDEFVIEPQVCAAALLIVAKLMHDHKSAPTLFRHGSKSIVLQWTKESDSLYLTVSSNGLSVLLTTPQKIISRVDYKAVDLSDLSEVLKKVLLAQSEPIKIEVQP